MRKCPKCNVDVIDDDAKFCIECGANLSETVDATQTKSKNKISLRINKKKAVVNLQPNHPVNLLKIRPTLNEFTINFSWDCDHTSDIDASVFLLDVDEEISSEDDLIFYNNPRHPSGCVEHSRINDKSEQIKINLSTIPKHVKRLVFTLTTNDSMGFDGIQNLKMSFLEKGQDFLMCSPSQNFNLNDAIIIAEIKKYENTWLCQSIIEVLSGGLELICKKFGLDVEE